MTSLITLFQLRKVVHLLGTFSRGAAATAGDPFVGSVQNHLNISAISYQSAISEITKKILSLIVKAEKI